MNALREAAVAAASDETHMWEMFRLPLATTTLDRDAKLMQDSERRFSVRQDIKYITARKSHKELEN